MQKTLQLQLSKKFEKPVFALEGYLETFCLFDTGASMAVWCSTLAGFLKVFVNSVPAGYKTLLSGFGGSGEFVDVYKIPLLRVGAADNVINFRNVFVAVLAQNRFEFDMILPAVMFSKTDYTVINRCKDRKLQILADRDMFSFKMKVRKFTTKEAAFLKEELGLKVPESLQTFDGTECLGTVHQ